MTQQTTRIPVSSIILDEAIYPRKGIDPLLYAAKKAIGPKQLTEDEARDTARRANAGNTRLSSANIGKAIGRARRTVDGYIADLRAVNQMDLDIKILRMHRLGIPQDRIAKRLGMNQNPVPDQGIQLRFLLILPISNRLRDTMGKKLIPDEIREKVSIAVEKFNRQELKGIDARYIVRFQGRFLYLDRVAYSRKEPVCHSEP